MSLIDLASMVLAPTAVKDGKVYNAIPNDQDFTFSRGTEATRVNSAGLIEKARTNLLLQSNTFDTTWANVRTSETGGQSGYDGSNDAWKLSQTATSGGHYLNQSISQSGVSTLSIYAKAGEIDYIQIASASTNQQYANFDLTDGSIGNVGTRFFDAKTTSIGNGWYRLSVVNNGVSSLNGFYIVLITSKTSAWLESYSAANATDGLFIQSAQLEQGLVATDYIDTTTSSVTVGSTDDLPRVDYSGGGCPSLLLEPSRTNLVTHSEYFAGGGWANVGTTITTNATTSPSGNNDATLIVSSSGGSSRVQDYFGALSGNHSYSLFVKAYTTSTRLNIATNDNGSLVLTVPTSGTPTVYAQGPANTSYFITELSNGWYYVGFTFLPSGATNYFQIYPDASAQGGGVYVWGAQCESGSYSTSYLPTYGTSTSRSADSCSLTNASNLIGQSEGTLFLEFNIENISSQTNDPVLVFLRGTGTEGYLQINDSGRLDAVYYASGATQCRLQKIISTGTHKVAFAYKANDFVMYVDGVLADTDTSGVIGTLNECGLQYYNSAFYGKQGVKQTILFPTRLTNDQLAELTK